MERELPRHSLADPSWVEGFMADHWIPPKDVSCAEQSRRVRVFCREMGLSHFLEGGRVSEGGFQVLTETMVF